jgi:hypothetical protein
MRSQTNKPNLKDVISRRHQKIIASFFKQQKVMVQRVMNQRSLSERELEGAWHITPEYWDRIWENIANQTSDQLQKIIAHVEADGLQAGGTFGKKTIGSLSSGIAASFSLANPRAVAWFAQNGGSVDYIKGIQTTTSNAVKSIITKALDTGQEYGKTAKEISDTFDGMSRDRAQRIAVYETGNAYEEGNRQFADELVKDGVSMEKFWQTSENEKVCPICNGNEQEGWIPIDQPHKSGHQQCQAHLSCYCFELYREAAKE